MLVHVRFRPRRQDDRSVDLPDGATVKDLVEAVGEPIDVMVCVRGGAPIPDDSVLFEADELLLLSAASGG